VVVFEDETGFSEHPRISRVWARRGQPFRVPTASNHRRRLCLWVGGPPGGSARPDARAPGRYARIPGLADPLAAAMAGKGSPLVRGPSALASGASGQKVFGSPPPDPDGIPAALPARAQPAGANLAAVALRKDEQSLVQRLSIKLGGKSGKPPAAGQQKEFVVYVTFLKTFTLVP